MERSIYALTTLALAEGTDMDINLLKSTLTRRLEEETGLNQEERDRTARNIRRRAANLYREGHWASKIEMAMSQQNQNKLKPLLEDIANILSPDTAAEPVNVRVM
ncbi:MAG: hypothetical protein MRK01_14940 [Candidatus Scalindua sp.]|nr:hypothetical protein [Candidatus Scalindua sp.]